MKTLKDYAARFKAVPPRTLHVLVVDDEEPVRKFVERVLREAGYETRVAGDGPEALEVAKNGPAIDILVTDLMMPQMNGDELVRRLRQDEPALKVLYLTGSAIVSSRKNPRSGRTKRFWKSPAASRVCFRPSRCCTRESSNPTFLNRLVCASPGADSGGAP